MIKLNFPILLLCAMLCYCNEPNAIPDLSKQRAVSNQLYKKVFVIDKISDDLKHELLDSLFSCAKDDTFRIIRYDEDGEIPTQMDIIQRVDLGNDWCNQLNPTVRIGWAATYEHDAEIYFKFLLPPNYQRYIFSTKRGSRNSYSPDSQGNFTLSIINDLNTRIDYRFKKIGETP